MRALALASVILLGACASGNVFQPRSEYPPDPYVKGYADEDDCIGGERLAALKLDLPEYPRRAFRTGRQGWVLLQMDVAPDGTVSRAEAERSLPEGLFAKASERAASEWLFEPPGEQGLTNCRVLLRYRLGNVSIGG